jgi:asparagine synthetase B (glutamine-hydrolysing)
MCGLARRLDFTDQVDPDPAERRRLVAAMTAGLRHRGPDADGQRDDPAARIALGHRRLAVRDLSQAGHQPMFSAGGRFVIPFNVPEPLSIFEGIYKLPPGCLLTLTAEGLERGAHLGSVPFSCSGAGARSSIRETGGISLRPYWSRFDQSGISDIPWAYCTMFRTPWLPSGRAYLC